MVSLLTVLALSTISYFVNKSNRKIEQDFDEETYIVSSSTATKIVIFIGTIFALIITHFIMKELLSLKPFDPLWWFYLISPLAVVIGVIAYWERNCFRVLVYKDKFIVRNLFLKEREYSFTSLTDYFDSDAEYGIGSFEVYVGNKCVLEINSWDVGYWQLRDKIQKCVDKKNNEINQISVVTRKFTPLSVIVIYTIFVLMCYYYVLGEISGIIAEPEKILGIIFLIAIGYGSIKRCLTDLTVRIHLQSDKLTYHALFFIKKTFNISELRFEDSQKYGKGTYNVYLISGEEIKKVFVVPPYYKRAYALKRKLKKLE